MARASLPVRRAVRRAPSCLVALPLLTCYKLVNGGVRPSVNGKSDASEIVGYFVCVVVFRPCESRPCRGRIRSLAALSAARTPPRGRGTNRRSPASSRPATARRSAPPSTSPSGAIGGCVRRGADARQGAELSGRHPAGRSRQARRWCKALGPPFAPLGRRVDLLCSATVQGKRVT